jgi:hypothetical protein
MKDPAPIFLLGNPVDMRVRFDDRMRRINQNNFIPIISSVLTYQIGIQKH